MAQFDVNRSSDGSALLLDCQSDLLDHFDTRFVAPLVPTQTAEKLSRLHPVFKIDGKQHVMATQLASAMASADIGERVWSLAEHRYEIMNALDMLISGY
jgi:toxin CcdB